jgi:hypothetical protein
MSILNITPEQFIGEYQIAGGKYQNDNIQAYIDEYEIIYLKNLLGCELFELFNADLLNYIPQDPIYSVLYNPICVDLKNYCYDKKQIRSDGMVKMLKGFIYFMYIRDNKTPNTHTGNTQAENEVSEVVSFRKMGLPYRFNDAVRNYQNIQLFIDENRTNYPTFNGIYQDIIGVI